MENPFGHVVGRCRSCVTILARRCQYPRSHQDKSIFREGFDLLATSFDPSECDVPVRDLQPWPLIHSICSQSFVSVHNEDKINASKASGFNPFIAFFYKLQHACPVRPTSTCFCTIYARRWKSMADISTIPAPDYQVLHVIATFWGL